MKKMMVITIIVVLILLNALQFTWNHLAYRLFTDVVPDEKTALAIGKAVINATYGVDTDMGSLEVGYLPQKKAWLVGTMPPPEGYVGGVIQILIRKRDGKIIQMNASM